MCVLLLCYSVSVPVLILTPQSGLEQGWQGVGIVMPEFLCKQVHSVSPHTVQYSLGKSISCLSGTWYVLAQKPFHQNFEARRR